MKKNYKVKLKLINFELIKKDESNKLLGGFSLSLSSNSDILISGETNNCEGGNCASGCGVGQNVSCNTSAGCSNVGR